MKSSQSHTSSNARFDRLKLAAERGAVENVVVNERARMNHFQRRANIEMPPFYFARRLAAKERQGRTETFAAKLERIFQIRVKERVEVTEPLFEERRHVRQFAFDRPIERRHGVRGGLVGGLSHA